MFKNFNKFLKIKYEKNGRNYNACDCYGLCFLYNKEVLNKHIPEIINFDINTHAGISDAYDYGKSRFKKVRYNYEKPGDVISLIVRNFPLHVGVVIQKGIMMHIMEGKFATIESYNNLKWKDKVDSIWRYESFN